MSSSHINTNAIRNELAGHSKTFLSVWKQNGSQVRYFLDLHFPHNIYNDY